MYIEYVGEIRLFTGDYLPPRWMECQGQLVATHRGDLNLLPLLNLLGTSYGGDGRDSFGLPNLTPVSTLNGPALRWMICVEGTWPVNGMQGFTSEIRAYGPPVALGAPVPKGWALCDGRLLPVRDYPVLFLLLGTRFGGDGTTTFALPNLPSQGITPYLICLDGIDPTYGVVEGYLGDVRLSPLLDEPKNYAFADGREATITRQTALYSILGTRWGGDAALGTFNYPDVAPVNVGGQMFRYVLCTKGFYPSRS